MKDLYVNLAIWVQFMNATLRAAVHLGKDFDMNLRSVSNYLWRNAGQLFMETEQLVSGQTGTANINVIDFQDLRWMSTSSLCTVKLTNIPLPKRTSSPTLYSVLETWETILSSLGSKNSVVFGKYFKDLNRIDGQPVESNRFNR